MYRYTMMIPLMVLAALSVGLFVVGCGGGGDDSPGGASTGSLQFSVHFPPLPRKCGLR
jgi:ABC-type glycerol-3-phosphate transport system substrate-binding protein